MALKLNIKTPGIYMAETSLLPASVAQVETAIPAFIGYTENTLYNGQSLINKPTRISSMIEYESIFGKAQQHTVTINITADNKLDGDVLVSEPKFRMYYSLQMYFANGGGPCWISTAGNYQGNAIIYGTATTGLLCALNAISKVDEVTLIVIPDASGIQTAADFYNLYKAAINQSALLRDRFTIVDLYTDNTRTQPYNTIATDFQNGIGNDNLKYAAAYYPWLQTALTPYINEATTPVVGGTIPSGSFLRLDDQVNDINLSKSIFHSMPQLYTSIKNSISKNHIVLPPCATVAGVYAMVDRTRGVWKSPANVTLSNDIQPMVSINDLQQADMNINASGKSVNAIRTFTGKGVMVWGARTLAGNDNEWRYVSVRRFFNMVEESVKKAIQPFVFEPNTINTWTKIKSMIDNFLHLQWRSGALAGSKPNEAYFVNIGIGETMTQQDILDGKIIINIGMATSRPAEFIIVSLFLKTTNE